MKGQNEIHDSVVLRLAPKLDPGSSRYGKSPGKSVYTRALVYLGACIPGRYDQITTAQ